MASGKICARLAGGGSAAAAGLEFAAARTRLRTRLPMWVLNFQGVTLSSGSKFLILFDAGS